MENVLQWGVEVILALQANRSEALDAFFKAITQLGGMGHVFIVPLVIWSLGYRTGVRLLLALLLSAFVNFALKDVFAQPRPFDLDPSIGPEREMGYGIPSGHAQHTLLEWGLIIAWCKRRWFTLLAVTLIALIGFSRVWLGVHFPTDVLGGWLLGAAFLWATLRHGDAIAARLTAAGCAGQVSIALGVSLLFVLFYVVVPKTAYLIGLSGLWLGAALGVIVCTRLLQAPEGGALWQRVLRYLLGMVVLLVWLEQSAKWVPEVRGTAWYLAAWGNNFAGGLWLTAGAPALFQLLRLSPRPVRPVPDHAT
ncbi:MAG: hypothetical protein CALGDGBN_00070 [Pseudomonadales bacterium]|nr:hypothetical protein [Pseudomonadales bacterium]